MSMEKNYSIKCRCGNCFEVSVHSIPFGIDLEISRDYDGGLYYDVPGDSYEKEHISCPNCGSADMHKTYN